MPFQLNTLDELAGAGANIALDALHYAPNALLQALRQLPGNGSVTIRNAGMLSASDLRVIATALGARVILEG